MIRQILKIIFPFSFLLIGLYLVPIGIFELDFSKIPGDLGDARFNNYILEHGYQFLIGNVKSFWSAPFMYPYKESIAFSDNLLGALPIYAGFRGFGLDRETAFQSWILALFALNYLCSFYVLNKWTKNNVLAVAGAYVFSFSIILVGNIYNVQTLPRFILPFLFYWTWKFVEKKEIKYFLGISLGLVYQFYCGIYLGFLSLYVLMFFIISFFLIKREFLLFRKFKNKQFLFQFFSIFLCAVLLMLPLMLPYYDHSKLFGTRSFEDVFSSIPHLRSYFFTDKSPILWQSLSEHGTIIPVFWCHFLFVGIMPWLAIVMTPLVFFSKKINKKNKKVLAILLLTLGLSMLFTTNFNGFTLYKYIYLIPGFSAMRGVHRVMNTELFLFVLVMVFFFKELSSNIKYGKIIIWILPFLVAADNLLDTSHLMRFNKAEAQKRIELVKETIKSQKKSENSAIAYIPYDKSDNKIETHLDVMLASQDLNIACVNSYSGGSPHKLNPFLANMTKQDLDSWLEDYKGNHKAVELITAKGPSNYE